MVLLTQTFQRDLVLNVQERGKNDGEGEVGEKKAVMGKMGKRNTRMQDQIICLQM